MERSVLKAPLKKPDRPRSSFLSWLFNSSSSATQEEKSKPNLSYSTPIPTTQPALPPPPPPAAAAACDNVEIPNRRQSHLYTPFHKEDNKRRSYYSQQLSPTANISSSSLTRSATWQASTASNHTQTQKVELIPDRRTSRNYADNPEIQAKLDAMLHSDKASYLTAVLQNGSNNNINRRSTTPSRQL